MIYKTVEFSFIIQPIESITRQYVIGSFEGYVYTVIIYVKIAWGYNFIRFLVDIDCSYQ